MGVGAQGGAIAKRLDEEKNVSEIICADYDLKAAETLGNTLKKAKATQVDAGDVQNIVKAADGADIIVNGLPTDYNLNVIEAALLSNACYMDLCATYLEGQSLVDSAKHMFFKDKRFQEKGLLALTNTGSAPGMANILARESVDKMDSCDRIEMNVYEGVWTKKFIPFWWSPEVAFEDMSKNPTRFENGKFVDTTPFANPIMMKFRGIDKEIRMVDHSHEEPVTMGVHADKYMKGVKTIIFRYGGPHVEISEALYKMGFLTTKKKEYEGMKYTPFDLVIENAPPAPKYPEEIQAIIDEGLFTEEGAYQVKVEGQKDGKPICIENYVNAPGLIESFKKSGMSHESYFTGQCAYVFAKMMVEDVIKQKGIIAPEALGAEERKYFLKESAKLDITVDQIIEQRICE
jgi:saccharopine dehydrogenase-like NADP-dependent oxidoreductase